MPSSLGTVASRLALAAILAAVDRDVRAAARRRPAAPLAGRRRSHAVGRQRARRASPRRARFRGCGRRRSDAAAPQIVVTDVRPTSEAAQAGISPRARVTAIQSDGGYLVDLSQGLPPDPAALLTRWREAYWLGTRGPDHARRRRCGCRARHRARAPRGVAGRCARRAATGCGTHGAPLVQMAAFLAGAHRAPRRSAARGMTATLMTLALIVDGHRQRRPAARRRAFGPARRRAAAALRLAGDAAVVPDHRPRGALLSDAGADPRPPSAGSRRRWPRPPAPMFVISLPGGGSSCSAPTACCRRSRGCRRTPGSSTPRSPSRSPPTSLIVIEGIERYRTQPRCQRATPHPDRRVHRRAGGVRVRDQGRSCRCSRRSPAGRSSCPGSIESVAAGDRAAAGVRRCRTRSPSSTCSARARCCGSSLQYALARRTLSVLILLPIAALVISLISRARSPARRHHPRAADVLRRLPGAGRARVSLSRCRRSGGSTGGSSARSTTRARFSSRSPIACRYETDPRELVAMVLTQIDSALHPESMAVLAGDDDRLEVVSALRMQRRAAAARGRARHAAALVGRAARGVPGRRAVAGGAAAAERSRVAREGHATLLIPIFAGARSLRRTAAGEAACAARRHRSRSAQKRSEEPYTAEDRRLLSGIAAQMSVALDLSRLRRRRRQRAVASADGSTPTLTPTMVVGTAAAGAAALADVPDVPPLLRLRPHAGAARVPGRRRGAAAGVRDAAGRRRQVPRRRRGRHAAAWARCSARAICGSIATSRSRSCAPIWSPIPKRARGSSARRRSSPACSIRRSSPSSTTATCPTARRFW